jgi:hypothetical protein
MSSVEHIAAVGQSILDEITAMPAAQRRFNVLADFLSARLMAIADKETQAVLLDVLPGYVEQLGLIASASAYEQMTPEEFMAAMNSGAIAWGDLCLEMPSQPTRRSATQAKQLEFGWDLEIPELKLRKDIWENFPVTVEPLGAGADGAERHAIRVHRKNWSEWRQTKAADYDDWLNWDENTEFRLEKALESSRSWTVEQSADRSVFAVIRMNFVPRTTAVEEPAAAAAPAVDGWTHVPVRSAAPAAAPAAPASRAAAEPRLNRINDITALFPTCWNNETRPRSSARAGDIISISIHNTKLRDAGLDRATVERNLMAGLRASTAWLVKPAAAGSREFCRLEMLA